MIQRRVCNFFMAVIVIVLGPLNLMAQPAAVSDREPGDGEGPLAEKLYIHTDKNLYVAGEIIWFKVYMVENDEGHQIDISKLAYVEVLNRENKAVAQAKISLENGIGTGSLYLPVTLNSDYYIIRGYSNWMKNFSTTGFFEKRLTIVNTIKAPAIPGKIDSVAKANVRFFPEGGHLVQGIKTEIAFRVFDQAGKGIDARGIIKDEAGDTVLILSTYKFGIGRFDFEPVAGKKYQATLQLPGEEITVPLPEAEKKGYVINLVENTAQSLTLKLQVGGMDPTRRGEKVYLFAYTGQSLKAVKEGYLSYGQELRLSVEKDKLGEGISRLALLNSDHIPVCERLVFNPPGKHLRAEISPDKKEYGAREKVQMQIHLDGQPGEIDAAKLSVAVYRTGQFEEAQTGNILNSQWLGSELHSTIEAPDFYFSNEPGVKQAQDNLMLVSGWSQNSQNMGGENKKQPIKFIPELEGHFITARISRISDGQKAPAGIICYLSVPSIPFGLYTGRTDSAGVVRFEVKNYYGSGDIIVQAFSTDGLNYKADVLTPFSDAAPVMQLPVFSLSDIEENVILERSISMQTQNIYRADSLRRFSTALVEDTLHFYGKPEYVYYLDDYKRFTTMEEVLREYVMPITVVLKGSRLDMRIIDDLYKLHYDDYVLVLVDGVPIRDKNKIFDYNPEKVKKLEIVPRTYIYGPSLFAGIASFETYEGKFSAFELDPTLVAVDYDGLQLRREFYSPVYKMADQKESRIPDFRTTLLWKPDLMYSGKKEQSIEFYTSDQKGTFIAVLEGVSNTGEPIFTSTVFSVK